MGGFPLGTNGRLSSRPAPSGAARRFPGRPDARRLTCIPRQFCGLRDGKATPMRQRPVVLCRADLQFGRSPCGVPSSSLPGIPARRTRGAWSDRGGDGSGPRSAGSASACAVVDGGEDVGGSSRASLEGVSPDDNVLVHVSGRLARRGVLRLGGRPLAARCAPSARALAVARDGDVSLIAELVHEDDARRRPRRGRPRRLDGGGPRRARARLRAWSPRCARRARAIEGLAFTRVLLCAAWPTPHRRGEAPALGRLRARPRDARERSALAQSFTCVRGRVELELAPPAPPPAELDALIDAATDAAGLVARGRASARAARRRSTSPRQRVSELVAIARIRQQSSRDPDGAIDALEQARAIEPRRIPVLQALRRGYETLGRWASAIEVTGALADARADAGRPRRAALRAGAAGARAPAGRGARARLARAGARGRPVARRGARHARRTCARRSRRPSRCPCPQEVVESCHGTARGGRTTSSIPAARARASRQRPPRRAHRRRVPRALSLEELGRLGRRPADARRPVPLGDPHPRARHDRRRRLGAAAPRRDRTTCSRALFARRVARGGDGARRAARRARPSRRPRSGDPPRRGEHRVGRAQLPVGRARPRRPGAPTSTSCPRCPARSPPCARPSRRRRSGPSIVSGRSAKDLAFLAGAAPHVLPARGTRCSSTSRRATS